jgi:transcriptional regulator with XRE-family HTH domain
MSDPSDHPGHYIRQWRIHRGLTQAELADAIAVDRTYLNKIERGKRQYAPVLLEALAPVLACKPGDLISRRPGHSSELETVYMSLTEEDRLRALNLLRVAFGR